MRSIVAVRPLCLAIAVLATATCAGKFDHVFNPGPDKNSKCHNPITHDCDSSAYPILDYKMTAWFFHQPFKSCRPLYVAGGVHNCTKNMDLPSTREECESLCGETCTGSDGRKGVCSLAEHCRTDAIRSNNPLVCGAYGVKCCDRLGGGVVVDSSNNSSKPGGKPCKKSPSPAQRAAGRPPVSAAGNAIAGATRGGRDGDAAARPPPRS